MHQNNFLFGNELITFVKELIMRNLQFSDEFLEFINLSEPNVKTKIYYLFEIIKTQSVINSKVAKKLANTNFYEIRIQVNNEYRVIVFAIDHENINQSTEIVFLNGFMKKSTKDYEKQIKKAIKILEQWSE